MIKDYLDFKEASKSSGEWQKLCVQKLVERAGIPFDDVMVALGIFCEYTTVVHVSAFNSGYNRGYQEAKVKFTSCSKIDFVKVAEKLRGRDGLSVFENIEGMVAANGAMFKVYFNNKPN